MVKSHLFYFEGKFDVYSHVWYNISMENKLFTDITQNLDRKWNEILSEESNKEYFCNLMEFLHSEEELYNVYPSQDNWFKALELTPFNNVKVVILGQDPYHDEDQAHGLAFSVQDGIKVPPSLVNIYKEIENEFGTNIDKSNGNLEKWATQGVLLLNTVLTVREHAPNSHKNKGWEILTDRIIEELDNDSSPKVFLLWGSNAKKKKNLIKNQNHLILESSHPSPLSANRGGWFGNNHFILTNNFLKENNLDEISWTTK